MMVTKIIADSAADLTADHINGVPFVSVPLTMEIDGKRWVDDDELNLPAFLAALKVTHQQAISSCPNIKDWLNAFTGGDEIYVVTITSKLSGSYNAANQAAANYLEDHPDASIHVFDSASTSSQMQLILEYIAELVNQDCRFDKIVAKTEDYLKQSKLLFSLKELDNLANNGRVKPAIAKLAKLLGLYMIGTAADGEFQLLAKVRSEKRSQRALLKEMIASGYKGGKVRINHVQATAAANNLQKLILEQYPGAKVVIGPCRGLCSFYAENGGLMVGFEK
jgi:DegV family protein with EDD domain